MQHRPIQYCAALYGTWMHAHCSWDLSVFALGCLRVFPTHELEHLSPETASHTARRGGNLTMGRK